MSSDPEDDYSEEEYDDEEMSEGDDEDEGAAGAAGTKRAIYNVEGLHDKLEDISWTEEAGWEETLAITSTAPTQISNVDDDLERELAFYNQALEATVTAINRFEQAGTAWLRPTDYYAEMVKSDEHMNKVKDKLMYEQQLIEQAEERRKAREQKQYSKQVQAEKQKERSQDKKRQISQISQLRKQREKTGFKGELDYDAAINNMGKPPQQQMSKMQRAKVGERIQNRSPAPNKKRLQKNQKYGFGGRKGLAKQNDASSAADMDGYRPGRFDDGLKGTRGGGVQKGGRGRGGGRGGRGGGKGGRGGAASQRPGKARRADMKQKRR